MKLTEQDFELQLEEYMLLLPEPFFEEIVFHTIGTSIFLSHN